MTGSDTPTFSIAETTRTNHFSLLLRKLPNTKTEPKPTLKSKLILHLLKTEKKSITVLIFKVKIHDTPLINLYNCMHWSNEYHDAHSQRSQMWIKIIVLHWWQKLAKKWQKIVLPNLLSSDILWGKPNWLSIGRKFSRSSAKLRVRSTTRNWEVKKSLQLRKTVLYL